MLNDKILPKKCIYALRAVFELSFRNSAEPVTIEEIAHAQDIPARFLEIILLELKKGGIVDSVRGNEGGYILSAAPSQISVGDVIKMVWSKSKIDMRQKTYVRGYFGLSKVWEKVTFETERILNSTNFGILVENEKNYIQKDVPNYVI